MWRCCYLLWSVLQILSLGRYTADVTRAFVTRYMIAPFHKHHVLFPVDQLQSMRLAHRPWFLSQMCTPRLHVSAVCNYIQKRATLYRIVTRKAGSRTACSDVWRTCLKVVTCSRAWVGRGQEVKDQDWRDIEDTHKTQRGTITCRHGDGERHVDRDGGGRDSPPPF